MIGALAAWAAAACSPDVRIEQRIEYVDRPGCLACHRPLVGAGVPEGIEEAHPRVADYDGDGVLDEMPCVRCHGGDPTARSVRQAHEHTALFAGDFLRGLTTRELDDVHELEPAHLRFINPADLRAAPASCGAGDGESCHDDIVATVRNAPMATFAGDLDVPRYRAGQQATSLAIWGVRSAVDREYDVAAAPPSTVPSLDAAEPAPLRPGETEIGPFQDIYLAKACARCHLWSFGENRFPGDYRSSGCAACHMPYNDDGLSRSADPTVDKGAPPHPARHALTRAPTTDQCVHCHHGGGRIGLSYQGYRERGAPGTNPEHATSLGEPLHGHDAGFYLVDEDDRNAEDETPPDVHFEAGMHCIDCHTPADVHGDGRLYSDAAAAVEIECEDCHGTASARSALATSAGRPLSNLATDEAGAVWLTGKVDGVRRRVTQVADIPGPPGAHGGGHDHGERLECYACHSAWLPACYGCHVEVDMRQVRISLLSGEVTPGGFTASPGRVVTDSFVLMENSEGRVAPSMPAEKMFFTAIDGAGRVIADRAVRRGRAGVPGMGQRAFQPHTVQRATPWGRCRTCHPAADGSNGDRVRETVGHGSGRFVEADGAGDSWVLDRLVDPDTGGPAVLVGHDEPSVSGPLRPETIEAMMSVTVP